jgi:tetratricopeptide (TPR) repeat protein
MNPRSNSWSSLVAAALATAAVLLTCSARADDPPPLSDVSRAETLSAEAFEAYSNQDYDQAVALYLSAFEASPTPDILYNLARIYDTKLKDRRLAIDNYQRYVDDPGADPARVADIQERLTRLREVERLSAQPAPAPQPAASSRAVAVAHEPPSAHAPPARPASGLSSTQLAGIVTGVVGVAGVGVGMGFGVAARSDADIAHGLCDDNVCVSQRGVTAAKDAKRAATISTVSFIAGGALLATGMALILFGPSDGPREIATFHFLPYADRDTLGTQLAGRW